MNGTLKQTVVLTDRDIDLLNTLLRSVRFLSLDQVGRTWWSNSQSPANNARRRINRLQDLGYLKLFTIVAHREVLPKMPYFRWTPDSEEPDFGALAYRLGQRWTEPYQATRSVLATAEAARRFGGRGDKFPKTAEETHDLHLASLYLLFRKRLLNGADTWVHEDQLKKPPPGEKVPDAFLVSGPDRTAIEIAGKYPKEKLIAFHRHCQSHNLPYELW